MSTVRPYFDTYPLKGQILTPCEILTTAHVAQFFERACNGLASSLPCFVLLGKIFVNHRPLRWREVEVTEGAKISFLGKIDGPGK